MEIQVKLEDLKKKKLKKIQTIGNVNSLRCKQDLTTLRFQTQKQTHKIIHKLKITQCKLKIT